MTRNPYLVLLWLCLSLVPYTFAQGAKNHDDPLTAFEKALKADGFAEV